MVTLVTLRRQSTATYEFFGVVERIASSRCDPMDNGVHSLTEKEKETLRLMLRGHDAKSMANHLDLSVHTINERLRAARRKLSVTSSREVARLLYESEGEQDKSSVDRELGEAFGSETGDVSDGPFGKQGPQFLRGALIMLTILAAGLILTSQIYDADKGAPFEAAQVEDEAVSNVARDWLELVDAKDWQASFDAAGKTFRDVNTVAGWQDASEQARVPLGEMISRELVKIKYVNAPPSGFRSVVFFTTFADGGEAIEMVTLEREESGWRVVGYIIE